MANSDLISLYYTRDLFHEMEMEDPSEEKGALFYKNLSRLVTSPDLLSRLQDIIKPRFSFLHIRKSVIGFQWLGPHFLAFLKYATKLCSSSKYRYERFRVPRSTTKPCLCFNNLLKSLDDSASDCILYRETEHYKNFLKIVVSFMPELNKLFTIQNQSESDSRKTISDCLMMVTSFVDFLVETIGELLNYGTDSSVLVTNRVEVLLKELKFLLLFLVDTVQCIDNLENSKIEFTEIRYVSKKEEIENIYEEKILTEIEAVSNGAGLFLHSFFFTTDLVTAAKMDLAISVLLERIENVKVKIKDYCIAVSVMLNCGIGSLQVAESPTQVSVSSSRDNSIPVVEEVIVGFEDMTAQIVRKLLEGPNYRQIISIIGMGGLGKTTLAKKIYNDPNVRYYFDKLSWCAVSQIYKKRKLLIDILSSASDLDRDEMSEMEDEALAECLYKNLKGRRYFIVVDDLWDKQAWDDMKRLFPEDRNGSGVLFTSRMKNMGLEISRVIFEPRPLSLGESWNLLKQNVFKKEPCPEELQDIGKQIARNCHGLPLSIITIAGVLSTMEKRESLWQQVENSLSCYISQKADDYIPSLKLSYIHLPNHLKPCFLYLSAFKEDEEISVRKLLLLWIAEGLVEEKEDKSIEDVAEEYLMELINRSLLQVSKRRSDNGVKACSLHDLLLDMCGKIALEDEKFLFQHQFLVSKHRHRLFADQSHDPSEALSILYNSEKIRILDSMYEENAVLGIKIMPEMRYLETPSLDSSICRLQNLEFLDVWADEIPIHLLNMRKLRHLCVRNQFMGARFCKNCDSSQINNLQTLCYVKIDGSEDEDEEILRLSPNLRRLKCKFSNYSYIHLNFLSQLESLKIVYESRFRGDCSVVNFPTNIKKLTLSKIGLSWGSMSLIGTLPNLEILKLEDKAFEGDIWNTNDEEFQKLKFLKLGNLNVRKWNSSYDHFPVLEQLRLRYCNCLEMIPYDFSNIPTLQKIEVFACSKKVESSALKIREGQQDNGNQEFDVTIYKFWEWYCSTNEEFEITIYKFWE